MAFATAGRSTCGALAATLTNLRHTSLRSITTVCWISSVPYYTNQALVLTRIDGPWSSKTSLISACKKIQPTAPKQRTFSITTSFKIKTSKSGRYPGDRLTKDTSIKVSHLHAGNQSKRTSSHTVIAIAQRRKLLRLTTNDSPK